jgi:hypothetical protein
MARRRDPASRTDRCPRCDGTFGCGVATGGCWCAEVTLTAEMRAKLAEEYDGCLCPACLRELTAPSAPAAPALP